MWPIRRKARTRSRSFRGGILLPSRRRDDTDRPTTPIAAPSRLFIPLADAHDLSVEPCVQIGQTVRCGELLSPVGPAGVAVHASADGVVAGIAVRDTPHAPEIPCVEIETHRAANPHVASAADIHSIEDLIAYVRSAGLVEHDESGESLEHRLREASRRGCDDLIVRGLDSDPLLEIDERILVERMDDVLAGARRLQALLAASRLWLAVDQRSLRLVARLLDAVAGTPVRVAPLFNKYPQSHSALLVLSVLGREIPLGGNDLDAGAFVTGAATLAAMESSIRSGMPMTHRLLAVGGPAVSRPGSYSVAIGMPIRHVIEHVGLDRPLARIVAGSAMTGTAVRHLDVVVNKRTSALVLLTGESARDASTGEPPRACIRCGWCIEHCPVGLDPRALLHAAERRRMDRAAALCLPACIDCGICSYVCPSGLPIAESIRAIRTDVGLTRRRTETRRTAEAVAE